MFNLSTIEKFEKNGWNFPSVNRNGLCYKENMNLKKLMKS